jgi:ligand-binding sensor domain-containing protein
VAEDDAGRLWIGTSQGVNLFDGDDFHTVELEEMAGAYVNHILVD